MMFEEVIMIFRRLVLFVLIGVSDIALADIIKDQALHTRIEKWDASLTKSGLGLA